MINKKVFNRLKGRVLNIPNTDWINGNFAKELRTNRFHMSQNAFSEALGISKKTIEAWESGKNSPSATAKKLLYLLYEHPELMKELYSFEEEGGYMVFNGSFTIPYPQLTIVNDIKVSSNCFEDINTNERLSYGA